MKKNLKIRDSELNLEMELQVCRSAAGYYLGFLQPDGSPYARFSAQYYTHEDAIDALENFPEVVVNGDFWTGRQLGIFDIIS